MARILSAVILSALLLTIPFTNARAGQDDLKKELAELNLITGNEPMRGALKALVDNKDRAKAMLDYAKPAAQKKELSYNAAIVLALVAAESKDMKTSELYFRVCMDKAAKLQSVEKLRQSYGTLLDLYFEYKQYGDCARICKELLELNTDDEKIREVRRTFVDRAGRVQIGDPEEGFKTALRLRPDVYETYIKAVAKQGKHDQALKLVDNLLKGKDDWIDLSLKGWVMREAGKLEAAAGIYEDVVKKIGADDRLPDKQKDEFIEQYRYDLSGVYIDLKKVDRATEHLEFLIKKRPEYPGFYNDLGYIWADHDMKLEEAEKMIRKALELDREVRKKSPKFDPKKDQDKGAYLDSLGWVLFKMKKNQEAKENLIKALEDKAAQHIEIYDHLGDVHMVLGERDLAIKAWQRGLEVVTESRRDQERKSEVERKLAKAKDSK
jgi:tetratricopeptide (TPR) repeat protein